MTTHGQQGLATPSNERGRASFGRLVVLAAVLAGTALVGCGSGDDLGTATATTAGRGDRVRDERIPTTAGTAVTPQPPAAAASRTATTSNVYPCDPPALRLAADLLDVESLELRPGERYPSTGSCVFWTRSDPGVFGVVQLVRSDSDPLAWPCGPEQVTRQQRADVNGSPALVRACTTP